MISFQLKDVQIPAELYDLIPGFINRRHQDGVELKKLWAMNEFESISRIGHKLKGNGLSYGFKFLSQTGAEIEVAAQNKNTYELQRLIDNYINWVNSAKKHLCF